MMTHTPTALEDRLESETGFSPGARAELEALGLDAEAFTFRRPMAGIEPAAGRELIPRRPISAPSVLNEAYGYAPRASSFTRGLCVELPGATMLLLSGTASIDERGRTLHVGDIRAQCLRTYRNLTALLAAEGASWHDIVRTTCYLRDIDRDYDTFNDIRTMFLKAIGVDPLPASTGIQAHLCRPDLLVEIEAMAMLPKERG